MGNPRKPYKKNDGGSESQLHASARSGDLRAVESICISNPLAVNSRDRLSRTPLHLAAWSGHSEVVSYLCKNKADVGAAAMDDTGAIHFASQKGHLEVVRILLSAGVSVKAANRKGMTPLHFAAHGSHLELVKYLIRKGASPIVKSKSGQTAADIANGEEIRSYLTECEKEGKELASSNAKESSKTSVSDANRDDLGDKGGEGEKEAGEKRKSEGADEISSSQPKRGKVSLEHLVAEEDEQDQFED